MRLSSASLAALAALATLASPSTEAFSRPAAVPAPPRSRAVADRLRRPFFRPRGHTGPAREDHSPAGIARMSAAALKRARRAARNRYQAFCGGWGAVAREDAIRDRTVF